MLELVIPTHPILQDDLDPWRAEAATLSIPAGPGGKPWNPIKVSQYLAATLVKIGLPAGPNVHGLRKLCATELADYGCSTHEIETITGHVSLSMIRLYARTADRKRLAEAVVIRLSEWIQMAVPTQGSQRISPA